MIGERINYKKFIPLITFILIFFVHLLYFVIFITNFSSKWWAIYLKMQQYFVGFSLALAFSYGVFSFIKLRHSRNISKRATAGSAILAFFVWFTSCCGAPLLVAFLGILGISIGTVIFPPAAVALVTIIFVSFGYLWLKKKTSGAKFSM